MGYIPLFLTVSAACLLFFLTVKNNLQSKLRLQRDLLSKLNIDHPELGLTSGQIHNPDLLLGKWKSINPGKKIPKKSLEVIKSLKINRLHYNNLIKKPPYNWVAAIGGFHPI